MEERAKGSDRRPGLWRGMGAILGVALLAGAGRPAVAQAAALPDAPQPQQEARDAVTARNSPRQVFEDQRAIWTSPARLRGRDALWLAPLALATGAAIASDHRAMRDVVSSNASLNQDSINASNALIGGFVAAPVALFGYGHLKQNEKARETGILSSEALVDGLVVEEAMKLAFWRERPTADSARGRFFQSSAGADSSFPSAHATLAWAAAASIAGEYRSPWTQIFVYSAATGVSLTRVMGQEHFPSDVLVGSAVGWLVGHYVVRRRHRHFLSRY